MSQEIFSQLLRHSREASLLQSTLGLLEWDQETYMPPEGISIRSEQKSLLASLLHQKRKAPKVIELLSQLVDISTGKILDKSLDEHQKAIVREWHRDLSQTLKLPDELVASLSQITSEATHVWAKARAQNDFSLFAPYLEKIVELNRKKAEFLGCKGHPYNALLDLYEPKMTVETLDELFESVKKELIPSIRKLKKHSTSPDYKLEPAEFQDQYEFCCDLLEKMGIDFQRGRLDRTSHPFCMGLSPSDLRLTIHTDSSLLIENIMGALHEGGHGLYEQGIPLSEYGCPLGSAASMGIHESQSRFWETRIGLSLPFWRYFYPQLKQRFPRLFSQTTLEEFYTHMNEAYPSFIRIHSDEFTYSLHIIIRYELEKSLIDGSLKVVDLPKAFNDKMVHYLGIKPENDRVGCMQDIHWAAGLFGYFPTYALGNMYGAQLFNTFEKEHSDWEERAARGEFHYIRDWLSDKIYIHGRRYSPQELIQNATGEKLNSRYYTTYLLNKFNPQTSRKSHEVSVP